MSEVIECGQPDEADYNRGSSYPYLVLKRVKRVSGRSGFFLDCLSDSYSYFVTRKPWFAFTSFHHIAFKTHNNHLIISSLASLRCVILKFLSRNPCGFTSDRVTSTRDASEAKSRVLLLVARS